MGLGRITFRVSVSLDNLDPETAWGRLSDVESIPKYWHGHREVTVIERRGNSYYVRIRYAFPAPRNLNIGHAWINVDNKTKTLTFNNVDGPVRGVIKAYVDEAGKALVCEYDVDITWWQIPMKWWVRKHFMQGVRDALDRIVRS
ncbi:hypothetical protein [Vulcanisaeta thermophila]|uniref:hypothetical protein n=1 Tax=Vulcanisaeta thermophila TaxID=867917 RepID=UPI00085369AB|nr:hypothetical protein [Vulcanisaeta thermophila]